MPGVGVDVALPSIRETQVRHTLGTPMSSVCPGVPPCPVPRREVERARFVVVVVVVF